MSAPTEPAVEASTNPSPTTDTPGTMKAIVRERYGLEALELREVDLPAIADDQVLVRVHASSVNPAEWYGVTAPPFARAFGSGLRKPKSARIGADLAGRVEAVGRDVTEFRPGDEVFGTSGASWAEYAPAREVRLVRKPANVSWEEAAAVPVAALTALQALRDKGGVQPGQKVLINGASGGVGTYAVQLAKVFGAEVTAVCSSRNVETAASLGADVVCDYMQEDFARSPVRHDLMIDIAGSRSFREFRRVLTPEATVVVVGAKFPSRGGIGPLSHVIATRLAAVGKGQTVKFFIAKIEKDDLAFLAELLGAGKLRSVIDRRFELSETVDALNYLGEGHARGKVIISM
jgi:NADPH:quinone reductase-like Zn-dependent oxidoreductase